MTETRGIEGIASELFEAAQKFYAAMLKTTPPETGPSALTVFDNTGMRIVIYPPGSVEVCRVTVKGAEQVRDLETETGQGGGV